MTWQDFVSRYRRQITGVARQIERRWRAPQAVEVADLEQEIMLAAWVAWQRWEPNRGGMSREAFALCSGRLDAQRWMHQQRNAPRRSGKAAGRYPASASTFGDAGLPDVAQLPGQEFAVLFSEAIREALARHSGNEGDPISDAELRRIWAQKEKECTI